MPCQLPDHLIDKALAFHGHSCPGLAIGLRAAELALERLGHHDEVGLCAVVETDMCGVDAIQCLTGCTLGKGNLVHRDHGKMAFSFFPATGGGAFRAVLRPEAREGFGPEEREALTERLMALELDELFAVTPLAASAPRPPRILESLACAACGEMTMESRTRRMGGQTLCIPCFAAVEQKV